MMGWRRAQSNTSLEKATAIRGEWEAEGEGEDRQKINKQKVEHRKRRDTGSEAWHRGGPVGRL